MTLAVVLALVMAGEMLPNGIALPPDFSRPTFESLTRETQRVPYLENRPEVVPINVGRQLFVDDFLIEKGDLRRVWHYPVKYAGNPILKPETPLEINRPKNSTARVSGGGVWWDPTRTVYRMWYEAGWLNTDVDGGDFYSFWVSPSARGESRGYVAAGGPDYPGARDL